MYTLVKFPHKKLLERVGERDVAQWLSNIFEVLGLTLSTKQKKKGLEENTLEW
jgi:hypothetical protein